ncbi:MAG: L,D-transpeptidase family protein, partial [Pseudomonadota bacterium]
MSFCFKIGLSHQPAAHQLPDRTGTSPVMACMAVLLALMTGIAGPTAAAAKTNSKASSKTKSAASISAALKAKKQQQTKEPLTIIISLAKQRLYAYRGLEQVATSRISSGKPGKRTPQGVFTILQKRRRHYSNLYAGA